MASRFSEVDENGIIYLMFRSLFFMAKISLATRTIFEKIENTREINP